MNQSSFATRLFVAVVLLLYCRKTRGDCSVDQFQCATSGLCIQLSAVCDRTSNCLDGSDEQNCAYGCTEEEFKCLDDTCVNKNVVCEGNFDCKDGLDEHNCTVCGPDGFECDVGECVSEAVRCNNNVDCSNGRDEDCFSIVGLIISLSSTVGISVLTATVVCLFCIGVWVKKHRNARVARAQTSARGSVVFMDETVFTDAQFSSGVAPPSYVTASDYETIQDPPAYQRKEDDDQEIAIPN